MKSKLKTISFFKEIVKIPRESGKEEQIANYLCEFAEKRKLPYKRDEFNNVIMKKKTKETEPIILQAHIDMVCEKEETKPFDFETNSIEIKEEDGWLMANRTTLGADNGIGVAQILAILDSDILCNIEAIFTVQEETTMTGAIQLDVSNIQGKYMLNLDGFEDKTIITESACFNDIVIKQQEKYSREKKGEFYHISLGGLKGGHSGFDIDKGYGNAIQVLANFLETIKEYKIIDLWGGTKFNVIPSSAYVEIESSTPMEELQDSCEKWVAKEKQKYIGLKIGVEKRSGKFQTLTSKRSKEIVQSLREWKDGVKNKEGTQVTTSINLGVVSIREGMMKIGMRSSRQKEEKKCIEEIEEYCKKYRKKMTMIGRQPGFYTQKESSFIKKIVKNSPYQDTKIKSVHITVEAGILKEKIPGLEVAIISPQIEGAHTIRERVNIESIEKTNLWLERIVENW